VALAFAAATSKPWPCSSPTATTTRFAGYLRMARSARWRARGPKAAPTATPPRRLSYSARMRGQAPPIERKDVAAFLAQGVSLALATRDDRRVVELVRCAAARVDAAGRVFVAVPLPEGKRSLANIRSTGVVALSAALPTTYSTVQLKGTDAQCLTWPEQEAAVAEHRQRFAAIMERIGMDASLAYELYSEGEYESIVFTPTEIYDQTPGPSAGLSLPR
jgi:hypothetical protein